MMPPAELPGIAWSALGSLTVPVAILDAAGLALFLNPAAERLMGLAAGEIAGRPLPLRERIRVAGDGIQSVEGVDGAWSAEARVACVEEGGRSFTVVSFHEAMDSGRLQEALQAALLIDRVTGVLNRRGFLMLTQQQMKLATRTQRGLYMILLRLDNAREVSKARGHLGEDRAALEAVDILGRSFRDSDIIGRIANDEFAAVAIEAGYESRGLLLGRLRRNIVEGRLDADEQVPLKMSIGAARFDPFAPCEIDELMALARTRLSPPDGRSSCEQIEVGQP